MAMLKGRVALVTGGASGMGRAMALALAEAGRLAAAEQAFSRSLALDPVAETRTNLANVLLRQGEVEAALGHFAQALVDDPNLAEARYGLGMAYYAKGEAVQALRALEDALEFRRLALLCQCHCVVPGGSHWC